jgi:hypothetical protein
MKNKKVAFIQVSTFYVKHYYGKLLIGDLTQKMKENIKRGSHGDRLKLESIVIEREIKDEEEYYYLYPEGHTTFNKEFHIKTDRLSGTEEIIKEAKLMLSGLNIKCKKYLVTLSGNIIKEIK